MLTINGYHQKSSLKTRPSQFSAFLTYAALESVETFTAQDYQRALAQLPQDGLIQATQALVNALESSGEQKEDYWTNRIRPFWQNIWPKSQHLASEGIAENLAQLSIAARGQFRTALSDILAWLRPVEHPHYIVSMLHESSISRQFPESALLLLNAIIDDQPWAPKELGECLKTIIEVKPVLQQDDRYKRLIEYFRRRG